MDRNNLMLFPNAHPHRRVRIQDRARSHLISMVGMLALSVLILLPAVSSVLAQPNTGPRPQAEQNAEDVATLLTADGGTAVPHQYIVVLRTDRVSASAVSDKVSYAEQTLGADVAFAYNSALLGFAATMSDVAVQALLDDPDVAYIEQDQIVAALDTQIDPPWGLDRIDQRTLPLSNSYTYANAGNGVHAYVIDTGIRATHNEFSGRIGDGYDFVDRDNNPNDCNGHGTHVAGTIGGARYGVAKQVTLHAVRVLNCSGSGTNSGVIAGIDWVTANRILPAVANMSLGGGPSSALDQALRNSVAAGVVHVVAAGNENANACGGSPAREPAAITVGATSSSDRRASFSNYGSCLDIFAPGSSILSAWSSSNSAANTISGTSMASPHVAGAAALHLAASPSAAPDTIAATLVTNATDGAVGNAGTGSPNKLLYVDGNAGPPPEPSSEPTEEPTEEPTPTPEPTPEPTPQPTPLADEFEPDDINAEASEILTDGTPQVHNFHQEDDRDWVKFQAEAYCIYTIETFDLTDQTDTYVTLYAADGTTVLATNDDSDGVASRILWTAPSTSGLYFVEVRDYYPGSYGEGTEYKLRIIRGDCTPPPPLSGPEADPYESDNRYTNAKPITTDGVAQTRNFHQRSDQDWVTFNTEIGCTYTLETSRLGERADTFLSLYSTDGRSRLRSNDDGGQDKASLITWTAPQSARYYAMVKQYNRNIYGANTQYDLHISKGQCATLMDGPDGYEPDDGKDQATKIAVDGSVQFHNFDRRGDNDWLMFDAVAGKRYTIETVDLGPAADTYLYLYNTNGSTILMRNDNGGQGAASLLAWTASRDGTYFVRARSRFSSAFGPGHEYGIRVVESVSTAGLALPDARVAIAIVADDRQTADPNAMQLRLCADGENVTGFGQAEFRIKSGAFADATPWDAMAYINAAGDAAQIASFYALSAPALYADAESDGSLCTATFHVTALSIAAVKQRGGQIMITASADVYRADGTIESVEAERTYFDFARTELSIAGGGELSAPAGAPALAIPIQGATSDLLVTLDDAPLTTTGSTNNRITVTLPMRLDAGSYELAVSHVDGGWDTATLHIIEVPGDSRLFLPIVK